MCRKAAPPNSSQRLRLQTPYIPVQEGTTMNTRPATIWTGPKISFQVIVTARAFLVLAESVVGASYVFITKSLNNDCVF